MDKLVELTVLVLVALLGIGSGLFIMFSAVRKDKNRIDLPEKSVIGIFAISPAKKGQEWIVFLIGLVWVALWLTLLLALLFDWQ